MADIKTHLRELSVAIGIYYTYNNISFDNIYSFTPSDFISTCNKIISTDISVANNILTLNAFSQEHISIIHHSLLLGQSIVSNHLISNCSKILWVGGDTQKENPIDLYIDNAGFSLKENSFILENMGLYKFINLLTGSDFPRGLHVFEQFSFDEYNAWFKYTWNTMRISSLPWEFNSPNYISKISSSSSNINFIFNNQILSSLPNEEIPITQFINLTTSKSREKIFSKWINENLKYDSNYLRLKSLCSNKAGNELCRYIYSNFNPANFSRLLQVYNEPYYYAKSTANELSIFKVPGINDFERTIRINDISYSVPSSQLNILTEIENTTTNQLLRFRNECRFSHGQFNGTPEAKMYYESGNDLSVIYERII